MTTTMTSTPVDESALLAQLRAGDDAAFEHLVRENTPRMLATAKRFLGTEDEAMDAVQEAFISAFKALPTFEGGSRLSTWLHRIVINASLMRLRARKARPAVAIEDLLPRFRADGHQLDPADPWAESGDALLRRAEVRDMVRKRIDELPEDYRNVLLLRDIEELDTESAASVLGITAGAVKTRLHRARQALRALLEQDLAP